MKKWGKVGRCAHVAFLTIFFFARLFLLGMRTGAPAGLFFCWKINVFQGTSLLSLDAKGRMTMPSRHREELMDKCALEVTITRHPDGCLLIYPRDVWLERREALSKLGYAARVLQRIVLGSAVDLTIDSAGRLLIPADLRVLAGLTKEVALVGLGTHFELWDAQELARQESEALAAGIEAAAGGFQF